MLSGGKNWVNIFWQKKNCVIIFKAENNFLVKKKNCGRKKLGSKKFGADFSLFE